MKAAEVQILIEKYFNGETSLDEENKLSAYFLAGNTPPELEKYAPLFLFYAQERAIQMEREIDALTVEENPTPILSLGKKQKIFLLNPFLLKIAAVILIAIVSSVLWMKYPLLPKNANLVAFNRHKAKAVTFDENDDPQQAYLKIKSALLMVSGKMKEGTGPVEENMEKINEATRRIK